MANFQGIVIIVAILLLIIALILIGLLSDIKFSVVTFISGCLNSSGKSTFTIC